MVFVQISFFFMFIHLILIEFHRCLKQIRNFCCFCQIIILIFTACLLQFTVYKMKNFEDLLSETHAVHHEKLAITGVGQIKEQKFLDQARNIAIKVVVPISLSLITGPFATVSTLLQMTNRPIVNTIEMKLKSVDPKDPIYKHIKNGLFGDQKPYKAFEFKNYFDALKQIGKEGIKGIYKGNLTGIIYMGLNSKLRTELYAKATEVFLTEQQRQQRNFLKQNLITITTCTLTDLITLPLMFSQSRLIMQNSLSNYRVYKSPIDVLKKVSFKNLYTGSMLLVLKNTFFSVAWLQFIKDSPAYSFILSSVLSHLITYPFITILRQMQVNSPNTMMMNDRQQTILEATKRIWKSMGIRGFYRGFIGYGMVHFFLGTIMVEQNLRTGYFQQVK